MNLLSFTFGSYQEKRLIGAIYLLAAAVSAVMLHMKDMWAFPYLGFPLYLCLCGLLVLIFPLSALRQSSLWKALYRMLPVVLFMGAISMASSFTFPSGESLDISDIYLHGIEFFAFGFLTKRMVSPMQKNSTRLLPVLLSLLIVTGFAYVDETHQRFVPGREYSQKDLLSDVTGGLVGILTFAILSPYVKNRPDRHNSQRV